MTKPSPVLTLGRVFSFLRFIMVRYWWPRQESNLDLELRKLLYYPLYYEAGWQNSCHGKWLMPKLYNITAEYLYRNGQQYYAKKFSYDHHSIRAQCFFYPLQ